MYWRKPEIPRSQLGIIGHSGSISGLPIGLLETNRWHMKTTLWFIFHKEIKSNCLTLYVPIIAILDIWKTTLLIWRRIRRVRRIQVCMVRKGLSLYKTQIDLKVDVHLSLIRDSPHYKDFHYTRENGG